MDMISVASHFVDRKHIESIHPYGNGNVNDTYLVTLHGGNRHSILQRVNTFVFKRPEDVMNNMQHATRHLQECAQEESRAWRVQQVLPAHDGALFWQAPDETFWRMISFIENTESFDALYSHRQAYEVGYALGMFHEHINRLPANAFETVLEGFHISPGYLQAFDHACRSAEREHIHDRELDFALGCIARHRAHIDRLEQAKAQGILPVRIIHGDPKVNNILFDKISARAVSIIDLDTIQPGLVHYDIGDCARSGCNPVGEEAGVDWREAFFDVESFSHLVNGYLERAGRLMSSAECGYIYDAVFLMAFELGLRFLTDYFNGNVYYKIHFPEQNKYRALTQFKLAESIHQQRDRIHSIIKEMRFFCS